MKDKTIHKELVVASQIHYTEYPMVRYLLVLVFGMLFVVIWKNFSFDLVYAFNLIVIFSVGIFFVFHKSGVYYVLTFLTGFFLMNSTYTPIPQSLEGKIIPAHFAGTIEKIEKQTDSTLNCILDGTIKIVKYNGVLSDEKYTIRLMSYIHGDSIPSYLKVGANIESIVQIQFPKDSYFPSEFNSKQVLISKDIHANSSIVAHNIVISDNPKWTLESDLHNWRNAVEDSLQRFVLPKFVPFLLGMLFDQTKGIEQEDIDILGSFGLIHILSASGTHVVVITFICWFSLFMIRSHILKILILGILLILFVYVTGTQISAFRAAIMSFVFLIIPHFSRTIRPLNLLAFATVIQLIIQPTTLFSISFYFSTTAIIGIYLCYTRFSTLLKLGVENIFQNFIGKRFLNNVLIPSISLSLSAGLISNIIGSLIFYKFSLASIIGNTVFLFLYLLAFLSSIITYSFSLLSENLAYFSGIATSLFIDVANTGMYYLQKFIPTEITGYSIWIVALFFGVAMLYCSYSQHLRIFVFRCLVVIVCFPIVYITAKNLPYSVKEDFVYHFPNATLLPIHQNNNTVTYFLNIEPKSSQYTFEQLQRYLLLSDKHTHILINTNAPMIQKLDTLKEVTTLKITKQEQFLLYKYYLHKKTSQSRL
ncbi:MAG: ComEC/Rec2 family competence protein [Candidatus Kapabacteria bacterium]|nr:ComEC/Rec2 family competence protein [Candidatus Kapabacteria bacterium]